MQHVDMEYSSEQLLPSNQFTRNGYTFLGWSLEPNGTPTYSDCAEFKMGPDDEYTLYAIWKANENKFTFHSNGGNGSMHTDFTIKTDETAKLPENLFYRNGYKFIGWSTEIGGRVKYEDCAEYVMSKSGDVDLYANWEAIPYKITFESNGGSAIEDKTYYITDSDIKLPNPTRLGYTFDGWYEKSDLSGERVYYIYNGTYNDKKLYAKWDVNTYTIEFDTKCDEVYEDQKTYTIENPTFNLPTPIRNGYTFAGWYDNENCEGEPVSSIELGTVGDKKFYAGWSIVEYTISFVTDGGTEMQNIIYTVNDGVIEIPLPSREHYVFDGWYNSSDLTNRIDSI